MNTVWIDTNVFVRLLTRDDEKLYVKAKQIYKAFESGESKGVVSLLVVNEVLWVLGNYYELERDVFVDNFSKLLAISSIEIHEIKKDALMKILKYYRDTRFDFTDIYLRYMAKIEDIVSFDKDISRIGI